MLENIKQKVEAKLKNLIPELDTKQIDIQTRYRKAAAVLDYFDFSEINPLDGENNVKHALDSLLSVSRIVFDEKGVPQRALTDSVRREILETLVSESECEKSLSANPKRPHTDFQRMLEKCLAKNDLPALNTLNRRELLAVSQVSELLAGLTERVPAVEEVRRQMAINDLLNPFEFLLGITPDNPNGNFFGREAEINRLSDYVGFYDSSSYVEQFKRNFNQAFGFYRKPPLFIYAPGGMGKSTLLAKFILDHARFEGNKKIAFVYLDFDRAGLSIEEPVTLLIEALQQLIIQFPEKRVSLTELREQWFRRLNSDDEIRVEKSTGKHNSIRIKNHETYIREFVDIVKDLAIENKPLLFVLDTFEEVQYRSSIYVEEILMFFNELLEQLPTLRIVLSGRAEVKSNKFKLDLFPLPAFDAKAAEGYLINQGVNDAPTAASIVKQFGGVPLTLKLTAELYKMGEANTKGIPNVKTTEWFFKAEEEIIQGQLYDRILAGIRNDKVEKLVHPGLVLRRITPELILHVLALPCGIEVADLFEAQSLFDELKEEITLVVPFGETILKHRPDVRRVIINLMKKNKPEIVEQIHRRAIEYYQQFEDEISRAEEIYHRLSVEFDRAAVTERWIEGLQFSMDTIEELPQQSRIFLAARIGIELDDNVWKTADIQEWKLYAQKRATELISVERYEDALKLLRERGKGFHFPLLLLEITVLQRLHKFEEAFELAEEGEKEALIQANENAADEFKKFSELIKSYNINPTK